MTIILVSILAAGVLFVIYVLSSKEDRDIKDKYALHGKVEGYYSGSAERRRSERVNAELDVKYNLLKAAPPKFTANSRNISESGVAVILYEILPKNSLINMEISIPENSESIKTKGRVIWCEDRSGPERIDKDGRRTFVAGIEFAETDGKNKERLISYIKSRLAS
ncbi:MAG: PilZ domain-containing protein [Candidatus Omnitrophota bacterium]